MFRNFTISDSLLDRAALACVVLLTAGLFVAGCGGSHHDDSHKDDGPLAAVRVNVESLGRLPAFSHATTVGDLVFVSGTLGTKPRSIDLVAGGVGPETTQAMVNIEMILLEAGSSVEQIAKCIVYLTDMGDFSAMNEAWIAAVGPSPPARATIGVKELALGAVVEIECTAAR